ncbi:MAG: aspartate/glutamate racemase family protein [Nitrososphaeria archaeon]|nr:aspartate/glutamate racemase family protein [Nitrososphaeria archaeon]
MAASRKYRIGYVIPGIGLTLEEAERRKKIANKIVEHSSVDIVCVDSGPLTIENCVEEAYAASSYLSKIYSLQDLYDAFVVGCFGDPGLRAARELVNKLVVGPAESTLHLTSQLADAFIVISPLTNTVILTKHMIHSYGFGEKVTAIVPANIPVIEFIENREEASKKLAGLILNTVKEKGGDAVILGCMSMGYALVDELLMDKTNLPIINPVKVSLKTAEMLLSLNLKQSIKSFPKPDYNKLKHLLD